MLPDKLQLGNLPTKIEKLMHPPSDCALYLKRDDQTGTEYAGNKIRKLEYALAEALRQKKDTIITCGGLQSNHARATAAACVRLGLRCILLLKSDEQPEKDGNYLLDSLLGAEIRFVSGEDYSNRLEAICGKVAEESEKQGHPAYVIPIGASNGIGTCGYYEAYGEIVEQEKTLGVTFDTIAVTVGSGGTYAGLCFANADCGNPKKIVGIPITDNAAHFERVIAALWEEFSKINTETRAFDPNTVHLLDGYAGRGYALNTPEEMDFVARFARTEGIFLDPVYTGKAMRGLYKSLLTKHPMLKDAKNLLFIHTGGLYGLFPKRSEFT